MADYRGYVTAAGQQFEALAKQMHYPVKIGFIEIGDGTLPDNESPISRTSLVHKTKQFPAIVEQDPDRPGEWIAKCHIPADDAINGQGYFIREMGCKLVDQGDGVLYAYRRISNDWKPLITEGEAKSFIYILRFIPSNGELIKPTINPSVVYVDKQEQERRFREHAAEEDPHSQYAKENDVDTALKAIEKKVEQNAVPVLHPSWEPLRTSIRVGYVPADGQIIDNGRALYPDAWAAIQAGLVPVCTEAEWLANPSMRGCYTVGDGKTSFRVPDYNGKYEGSIAAPFFRGDGKNSAPNGQIQLDAMRELKGKFYLHGGGTDGSGSTAVKMGDGVFGNADETIQQNNWPGPYPGKTPTDKSVDVVEFRASRQVNTGAEFRPVALSGCIAIRLFGAVQNTGSANAAELATAIAGLAARLSTVESTVNARKSTCLVNAVGTGAPHETVVAQLPANVAKNSIYILPNPFGNNVPVQCKAEIFVNGEWGETGWIYTTSGYGVRALYSQGKGIVVVTGGGYLAAGANDGGNNLNMQSVPTSAPCRVFVSKLEA